jgi:uncharacterized protein (TIGR03435 family)
MQITNLGRSPILAVILLPLASSVYGQPPQHFEVASIRLSQEAPGAGTAVDLYEGGRIKIVNEPVKLLIRQAFRVQDSQISGGPGWLDSDRYDLEAKTGSPGKLRTDEIGPLMQNLLAERFNLKFHHEKREMNVLALVVAKSGPKFKSKADGETTGMDTSGGSGESHMTATATTMELLAGYVGNRMNRIVVDQTGLSDSYDFKLDWARDGASDSRLPSLTTALGEQLGLGLQSRKAPVEVLVIDSLERPSAN